MASLLRAFLLVLCAGMVLAVAGGEAAAYISIRVPTGQTGQGVPVRWDLNNTMNRPNISNGRVLYEIADAGCADAGGFTGPINEFEAVQNSFANWRNVHESRVDFEFAGATTNAVTSASDNRNVIRWVDSNISAGVLGQTITTFDAVTGEIVDADMELNDRDFTWDTLGPGGTSGVIGRAMIENTVTHEIGHMLGFDHPNNSQAALHYSSNPGMINQTTLEDDDRAVLISDYTNPGVPASDLGTVRGSVEAGGTARFGVYVTLVDVSTGRNVVGHVSENAHQSFTLGDYEINGVPPGIYFAFASPVDTSHLGSYYQGAYTSFFPVVQGVGVGTVGPPTPVRVAAGEAVTGVDISLPGASQNPFEPDNNDTEATPIASGEVGVARINPSNDEDWYSFTTTQPNQQATIRVLSDVFGFSLNPTLTLYDSDGSTVLVSPEFGHPQFVSSANDVDDTAFDLSGVNFDAEIVHTFANAGTYYFAVASRVGATVGNYIATLEISGEDQTPDTHASVIETSAPGVPAGTANSFTVTVTPRNLFSRDLNAPNSFDVELLDVSGATPVVLQTITGGTTPFDFTVSAQSTAEVVTYSARIDGTRIEDEVRVSHYGTLSLTNSRITLLVESLNANGYDRVPVMVELRDGSNNPLPDSGVNVQLSTTAGTLDNGSTSGAANIGATFDSGRGVWLIDLVAPTNSGTATVTAFANSQQVDSKQVAILTRAEGTGGGSGNGGGGGGDDDDDDDGGCSTQRGKGPAMLIAVLALLAAAFRLTQRRGGIEKSKYGQGARI